MAVVANIFNRHKNLFLLLIGLIVLCAIVYALREPLLPFFVGFIIAYLLMPVVDWIDKRLPFQRKGHVAQRIIVILVTFLIILVLICLIAFLVLSSFVGSFSMLIANAPTIISEGLQTLGEWFQSLIRDLTPQQQLQAQDFMNKIGEAIGNWLQEAFVSGIKFIPSTFTFVVGFMTLPFFLILFMANIHTLGKGFYGMFSSEIGYHIRNFLKILDNIFGRYIRAQILLGLVMGILVYIALLIIGIDLAPALAVIAAAFQLVPAIGGALAGIVGVIVTLAVVPAKVVWVILAYLVINLVGGSVLIAKFQGDAVNIDASIVMILIIVGAYLGGILGMILITPFVAILYSLYKYVRDEVQRSQCSGDS